MFQPGAGERVDRRAVHGALGFLVQPGQLAVGQPVPELRAPLERQAVGRDVPRAQLERRGKIALPAGQRFAGRAENQVDRNRANSLAGQLDRAAQQRRRMVPLQQPELFRIERLAPQADPVHAPLGEQFDQVRTEIDRVGLDAEFVPRGQRKPAQHGIDQPGQPVERQVRGRAAAEKQRVHLARPPQGRQFQGDGLQVAVHQVVAAGHEGEIAVAAAVGTERHVDVRGPRLRSFVQLGGRGRRGHECIVAPGAVRQNRPAGRDRDAWARFAGCQGRQGVAVSGGL